MAVLLAQIQKKNGTLDCGDFAEFARDDGLRFCSPDSTRALPGCSPIDRLFWKMTAAKQPSSLWEIIKGYWKELERTPTTKERDQYLKAFEEKTNKKPLGISTELFEKCRSKIAASQDFSDFIWFHRSGPVGALHYAIARYSWLSAHHPDSPARSEAEERLWEYVQKVLAKDFPETEHNKPILSDGQEIVGQAMIHHGYERLTMDVDFLSEENARKSWRMILRDFGYEVALETPAFEQFCKSEPGWPQVDIMFVNAGTWAHLSGQAEDKPGGRITVRVPSPTHMVALKLHAASSPQSSDPEMDWNDVFQLAKRHRLDPNQEPFASLVRRYGGDAALEKLRSHKERLS